MMNCAFRRGKCEKLICRKKCIIQIVVATAGLSLVVRGMDFIRVTGTFESVRKLKVAVWLVFGAAIVWELADYISITRTDDFFLTRLTMIRNNLWKLFAG
jgi:hypothetical protein